MESYSVEAVLKATGAQQFAKAFQNATTSAERFKGVGNKMKGVGKTMTAAITLPIVAMGTAIMHTGAKFDDQMSTVQAVTGATGKEMESMRELAKQLGRDTRFSATEASEGMEMLGRAGFETNEIMDALPDVLNLAAAGAVDLGDAADITSNILSGFGMEAGEASRVADILAQASADSNTDVQGLGEAFKYVGPVASSLGVSIEDTAASIGILGDAGIQGGQAGRMLRSGLQSLAAPTEGSAKLMKELGIEVFDAEGNMKSMPEVVKQLEGGLEGMTAQQKAATLETLFGADAMSAWQILVDSGADSLGDFSGELSDSKGAAGDMAAVMEDNLAGSIRSMKSALEGVAISFYEMGEGPVRTLVDKVTELARWFTNLSDETKQWIMIAAGILAVAGPIITFIGMVIAALPSIVAGLKLVGAAIAILTSPIGLVVAAIIAAAALIFIFWEPIKEFFLNMWSAIKEAGLLIWENLKEGWQNAKENLLEAWESVKEFFSGLWESVKEIFTTVWTAIASVVTSVVGSIKETITTVFNTIRTTISTILNGIRTVVTTIWNGIRTAITSVLNAIRSVISSVWNGIRSVISSVLNGIRSVVTSVWNGIRSVISSVMSGIRSVVTSAWNGIRSVVTSVVNAIRSVISSIFNSLSGIVSGAMSGVRSAVSSGITSALSVITGMVSSFFNAGKNIISAIADGIKAAASKVTGAIKGVASKIRGFLPFSPAKEGPLRDIMNIQIAESIAESIDNGKGVAAKAMQGLSSAIYAASPQDFDLGSRVNTINKQAERQLNHTVNTNVSRQPIVIHNITNLDGETIATGTYEYTDNLMGNKTNLNERWGR